MRWHLETPLETLPIFDVAVIGAGPAGLATGLACAELGLNAAVAGPAADPRDGRTAPRVIMQCRKRGRAPFRLLAPFVIHAGDAHAGDREHYTTAAQAVLRDGGGLSALFR